MARTRSDARGPRTRTYFWLPPSITISAMTRAVLCKHTERSFWLGRSGPRDEVRSRWGRRQSCVSGEIRSSVRAQYAGCSIWIGSRRERSASR